MRPRKCSVHGWPIQARSWLEWGFPHKADLHRNLQVWHGASREEMPARLCQQAHPFSRARDSRAVGGDAGIGVHLAINFRDQKKCQSSAARLDKAGTPPDGRETVKVVPHLLRSRTDFLV